MKALFICSTPLQCLIAEAIMERNRHAPEDCTLFYSSWVRNEKVGHYFDRLSARCAESVFHRCDTGYPQNLLGVRRYFRGRAFDRAYGACTNSPYMQMALSTARVAEIETFDDGTANLNDGGEYADRYGMSLLRRLSIRVLGSRMPQFRIREQARRHYTIFRDARNVATAPLEFLDIFHAPPAAHPERACTVILGTILAQILPQSHEQAGERLQAFARGLCGDVFYIPHPREQVLPLLGDLTLRSEKVAEDLVAGLLAQYGTVNVYGFGSSAQFIFAACPRIRNFCLDLPGLPPAITALQQRGVGEFGMQLQPL